MSPPSAISPPPRYETTSKSSTNHPLAPLSAVEITNASELLRTQWPANTDIQFKCITLAEPPKAELLPYLEAEKKAETLLPLPRKAFVTYYLRKTNKFHEAYVHLTEQKVESNKRLGLNVHGPGDGAEILALEKIALEDKEVQKELQKLQLPKGTVVVCDPWMYGSDGLNDEERMYQCFLYVRDVQNPQEVDSNYYALPLSISPVIKTETMKVIRIDHLPTGADAAVKQPQPYKIRSANEYIPERQTLRKDLKPLNVVQPEGVSFKVLQQGTSNVIKWQKWSFRVGFNQREGPVLYNICYDGRSLFHRVSLSDMNIPYADPRHPFHKKSAFDLGDAGAGGMANDLKLGCDCLGTIQYFSYDICDDKGGIKEKPNVICIHEQDNGIGWKHMNYRTGRAAVVRNRELVIQSILTVANYEYLLAYKFNQAAELHYEIRATGILSTQPVDDGVQVPWGTVVHPGVLATHHQHIFSLRIDPCIDGQSNRLVYTEAHSLPRSSNLNPHGTGYITRDNLIETSGGFDTNPDANRTFKVANHTVPANAINGAAPAYKIHLPPFQKMLSDEQSFNHARAEFADRSLYAIRYHDDELYAGGKYTNQSRGGTGVRNWAARKEDLVDQDLVLFAQFGINHIPRVEDFPVMPCEVVSVALKPVNFFDKNPALDVPPSEQSFNRSVLVSEGHRQGVTEGIVNGNGTLEGVTNGTNGHCNGH